MSTLRSLKLLAKVEEGTVLTAALNTELDNAGKLAEFKTLLTMRGPTRRMAINTITMDAIIGSANATNAVYQLAIPLNSEAVQKLTLDSGSVASSAADVTIINTIGNNDTSWGFYSGSAFYAANVKDVIANLAGLVPASYADVDALLASTPFAAVVTAPLSVKALLVHSPGVTTLAGTSAAMGVLAANTPAMTQLAEASAAMTIMAANTIAMDEIIASSGATGIAANSLIAVTAIAANQTAWDAFLIGGSFTANIKSVLANLIGVSPSDYATVGSIIDDSDAAALIANNAKAVQTIASDAGALASLTSSPNLSIILGSEVAMAVIAPLTSTMSDLLDVEAAIAPLFASSLGKGAIFVSTVMVDKVAANATTLAYLGTIAVEATAVANPDASIGAFQLFEDIPSKVLTLTARQNSAIATFVTYEFAGTATYGSTATGTFSAAGNVALDKIGAYDTLTWDLKAATATAAVKPVITYIDMT
jgi:hypothetical protein